MELFDNINKLLKDELLITIKKNSKVSIAAAYFSIYAYAELKKTIRKSRPCAFSIYFTNIYC